MISIDGLLAYSEKLLETIDDAKNLFDQKAIYVSYLGHAEIL